MPRKHTQAQLRRFYREVFDGGEAASAVLSDLLRFTGLADDAFVPGDPFTTAHLLGKQRVGQRIEALRKMERSEVYELLDAYQPTDTTTEPMTDDRPIVQ